MPCKLASEIGLHQKYVIIDCSTIDTANLALTTKCSLVTTPFSSWEGRIWAPDYSNTGIVLGEDPSYYNLIEVLGEIILGLLSQLFDLCTMIVDVECQWVRNTECYVVMATLHECGCVHMYTQSHSHYYM